MYELWISCNFMNFKGKKKNVLLKSIKVHTKIKKFTYFIINLSQNKPK